MIRLMSQPMIVPMTAVFPNFGAVDGAGQLRTVIGALLTVVLIIAVLMLIVCAVTWALSSAHGNYQAATKARTGLWVALGTATLAGAGVAWMNFLLGVGASL
ncbi:DUF6112 family protein [Rathayibacter soli]|uniref:DUF6112 family protein n=1 Tax=Rathayibacter soli TaxID=3144168 RepID=UPI0027E529B8|nr:DUF6112 family protein [Glaciibacter superstes]